eukprot:c6015_g1_i2.p2 GENE.c6015_g1_i2~~c6015_g1_i2.p2  ORF type:complete len:137 (-),score=9.10 c6015_g1_i2:329-739(-)
MGDREPGELSASPVRRRPSSDSKKRSRSPSSESSGERRKRSKKSEKGSKDKKRDRSKERSQKEKPRDKSSSKRSKKDKDSKKSKKKKRDSSSSSDSEPGGPVRLSKVDSQSTYFLFPPFPHLFCLWNYLTPSPCGW